MASTTIIISNHKYYLFDSYDTREQAQETAIYFKKNRRLKYFILQTEEGSILPESKYHVYLNKKLRLI